MTWVERFGDQEQWSTGCCLCGGRTFSNREDLTSAFQTSSTDRCPCWVLYMTMLRLWGQEFPKGYIQWNWDSTYPLDSFPSNHEWYQKHPESWVWKFSEEDESAIRFWVDNPVKVSTLGLSMVLYGEKGVGKSALATVLAKEYTKREGIDSTGYKSSFVPRFLVCDELYEYLTNRNWQGREIANNAMRSQLLVLDDLRMSYTGYVKSEYVERIHSFLQFRAGNNLPTIITSNKLGASQDFESNPITEFLGLVKGEMPSKFGKYRFINLTNNPLRPDPDWEV
jgi:hypothetical protein